MEGRRRLYSDLAITCALTLREVYHLPLRSTQGLVSSVLRLLGADLSAPHYSTLSRRAASLDVKLPRPGTGPLRLAVDSTGVKLYGEGEWKARLHGKEKRRTWRKLHLLIDHRTHKAVALSMTGKDTLDLRELSPLLGTVEGEEAQVSTYPVLCDIPERSLHFSLHQKTRHYGSESIVPVNVLSKSVIEGGGRNRTDE